MRTTIRLPGDLLRQAKQRAARAGLTLNGIITDALRRELAVAGRPRHRKPLRLHTFKGTGVRAGVDLNDTSSLLDVMDGLAAAARR